VGIARTAVGGRGQALGRDASWLLQGRPPATPRRGARRRSAAALIHSYALAESAAAERLGGDARDFGGIEDWGTRLLATTGSTWAALKDGLAGAVEVAVVRNAYAHGALRIDESAANRLRAVGIASPARGDLIALDYATVKVFRGRLRTLMDRGGVGRKAS
jgi:hypothetical protein